MIYKISATLCDIPLNIFLPKGFFDFSAKPSHLHRHYYTEIHIVYDGEIVYGIGEENFELKTGDFLVIPPHKMHSCVSVSENVRHSAFLIDKDILSVVHGTLSSSLMEDLIKNVKTAHEKENYFSLMGYFSMILSKAISDTRIFASEMRDNSFVIDNYIEKHYADSPSLGELALRLRLSEKQAGRLVQGHYGVPFSELITQKRMKTAEILKRTTDMTLKEISEYVGYSSYSGFYKAYNKFINHK